eukprot:5085669-Amphidinium_carterae.1
MMRRVACDASDCKANRRFLGKACGQCEEYDFMQHHQHLLIIHSISEARILSINGRVGERVSVCLSAVSEELKQVPLMVPAAFVI